MAHFEIKNLSFSYPVTPDKKTLNHINLTIERGQYVTVCGRSGSAVRRRMESFMELCQCQGKSVFRPDMWYKDAVCGWKEGRYLRVP